MYVDRVIHVNVFVASQFPESREAIIKRRLVHHRIQFHPVVNGGPGGGRTRGESIVNHIRERSVDRLDASIRFTGIRSTARLLDIWWKEFHGFLSAFWRPRRVCFVRGMRE